MCLRYAYSYEGGHLNATAESFELGEVYSPPIQRQRAGRGGPDGGAPEQHRTAGSGPELQQRRHLGDGHSVHFHLGPVGPVSAGRPHRRWVQLGRHPLDLARCHGPWSSEEDGDYFLYLHDPDNRFGLSFYLGNPYVPYSEAGGDSVVYQVTAMDGGQSAAEAVRAWFDEQQDAPRTADVQAGALMDAIRFNETVVMEMLRADGVGGGRYVTTPRGAANAEYTALNFTSPSLFTWSRAEDGLPPSPEPEASLILSSPDGRYAIQVWTGSDLVRCTDSGETYWLRAESTGQDVFSGSIFQHLRFWYDEVELTALQGNVVIPDTGQDHLAIAQAWRTRCRRSISG